MGLPHVVYYVGIVTGIGMFTASWLIRRKKITDAPLARAEMSLMVAGAGIAFIFGALGFIVF